MLVILEENKPEVVLLAHKGDKYKEILPENVLKTLHITFQSKIWNKLADHKIHFEQVNMEKRK